MALDLPATRRYDMLRERLERHVSPITAKVALERTTAELGLDPTQLSHEDLEALVQAVMVPLRMFVDAERLPRLMLTLADLLEVDRD